MNVIFLLKHFFGSKGSASDGGSYDHIERFYSSIGSLTVYVAIAGIFGVNFAVSILYLDMWHMVTSYLQHLSIASSYINILNMYAFSNWHDASWGTKSSGGDAVACSSSQNLKAFDDGLYIEKPERPATDIDTAFEITVKRALMPQRRPRTIVAQTSPDHRFRSFRTKLIAAYIFSNSFLCIFVMNDSLGNLKFLGDPYAHKVWFFRIWLWAISSCFGIRFVGSCWFLLKSIVMYWFIRR